MRTYTWDEYYEKFYDWAESTQVRNLSQLTTLGNVEEVAEIIFEMQVNVPAANRLLKRANEAKMAFKVDDLVEFLNICDVKLAEEAVFNSVMRLSEADMEELYGYMSEELITDICKQRKFQLPEDMRDEEDEDEEDFEEEIEEDVSKEYIEEEPAEEFVVPQRKPRDGFFAMLFAGIAGASEGINEAQNHHNGRCNGDCAHCPPHYGYRYGRWYYGHDHSHGCEFGGNKGGGGI